MDDLDNERKEEILRKKRIDLLNSGGRDMIVGFCEDLSRKKEKKKNIRKRKKKKKKNVKENLFDPFQQPEGMFDGETFGEIDFLEEENSRDPVPSVPSVPSPPPSPVPLGPGPDDLDMDGLMDFEDEFDSIADVERNPIEANILPPSKIHNESEISSKSSDSAKFVSFDKKERYKGILDDVLSKDVEILFLIDITGTMQSPINGIKKTVCLISKELSSIFHESFNVKVAFVGYRDFNEKSKNDKEKEMFEIAKWSDPKEIELFLRKVKARGGGDEAEDLIGGLEKTCELFKEVVMKENKKNEPVRILINMTDAPCHGAEFHDIDEDGEDETEDYYMGGDPLGRDVSEYLEFLRDNKIYYYFVQIPSAFSELMTTNTMIRKFRSWYDSDFFGMEVFRATQNYKRLIMQAVTRSIEISCKRK